MVDCKKDGSNVVLRRSLEAAFIGLCRKSKSNNDFMIPNFNGDCEKLSIRTGGGISRGGGGGGKTP